MAATSGLIERVRLLRERHYVISTISESGNEGDVSLGLGGWYVGGGCSRL